MSEATTSSPKDSSKPSGRKKAKSPKSAKVRKNKISMPVGESQGPVERSESSFPVFDLSDTPANMPQGVEEPAHASDWPEPEPASGGTPTAADHPKRKRRRKKGKGGQANVSQAPSAEEATSAAPRDIPVSATQVTPSKTKLDAEGVAKLAWKIFLAEVSEEGVALIGDHDARELSRRCFRLAEIFMEEQARRR